MQLRIIALAVAMVAVLGALVVLFVQVQATPDVVVPPEELDQARARYQRTQAARSAERTPRRPVTTRIAPRRTPDRRDDRAEPVRAAERPRPSLGGSSPPPTADEQLKAKRDEVRGAYDTGRFQDAMDAGIEYLRADPDNRYVQRALVVSACALGEERIAREYYARMVEADKRTSEIRCGRYSFQF